MKILVVTSGNLPMPPSRGGAVENLLLSFIDYNEQKKMDNLVIISSKDDEAEKWALKYSMSKFIYIDTQNYFFVMKKIICHAINKISGFKHGNAFVNESRRYISNEKPDIIIVENMPQYVVPIQKMTDRPIYLHLHNESLKTDTINNREIMKACTGVWTVSDYIGKQVKKIGINEERVHTLLNGLNVNRFKASEKSESLEALRNNYGIDKNDFVILYTGRIVPHKGVKELIQAFNKLQNKCKTKLLIVGSTFYDKVNKDDYFSELEKISEARKSDIVFSGYVPYDDMSKIYQLADLVVLPSICNEACGLTVIESLLCEKPLITTRMGGIPQVCEGTETILLNPDENLVHIITKNIENLIEHPEKLDSMSKSCRVVKQKLSEERYLTELEKLIHSV